ncbi:Arsj [Symbiodinium sp. CCMP2592]|nr:Arsj [Symbiodinium sp. CCMP2592]
MVVCILVVGTAAEPEISWGPACNRQAAMMPHTCFYLGLAGLWLASGVGETSQECDDNVELLQRKLSLESRKPHVLFFIADCMGWAGLGAHRTARNAAEAQGKAETQTSVLDGLIRDGVLLERHYTTSSSGPSRYSLISGRLPHSLPQLSENNLSSPGQLWNPEDNVSGFVGIPRNMTGIGSKLKQGGYATHYVGKWAAGHASPEHTPFGRGFDSFLGYLGAGNGYWSKVQDPLAAGPGICRKKFQDFSLYNATHRGAVDGMIAAELGCRRNVTGSSFTKFGCDEEDLNDCLPDSCHEESMLLEYAMRLIKSHDSSKPLFLTYSSHLVHRPYEFTASDSKLETRVQKSFEESKIAGKLPWTTARKDMAVSLASMDFVMGRLVETLKDRGMFEDTLVIFISDNGGATDLGSGANNYPLKSGKFTAWEGGVRTNAFISGGFIPAPNRGSSFDGVIHIADWYATLCNLAGVSHVDDVSAKANEQLRLEGRPLLAEVEGRPQLQNIFSGVNGRPDTLHLSPTTVLKWPYKLLTGRQSNSFWLGPVFPNCSSSNMPADTSTEDCGNGCLFNVEVDPGEHWDLSAKEDHVAVLSSLQEELKLMNSKTFRADFGHEQVQACVQSFQLGGCIGPFVDADDFYTTQQVPATEEVETYRQELMNEFIEPPLKLKPPGDLGCFYS